MEDKRGKEKWRIAEATVDEEESVEEKRGNEKGRKREVTKVEDSNGDIGL